MMQPYGVSHGEDHCLACRVQLMAPPTMTDPVPALDEAIIDPGH